jgi:t-SNARE complex subunit (syntaxin)
VTPGIEGRGEGASNGEDGSQVFSQALAQEGRRQEACNQEGASAALKFTLAR